MPLRSCDPDEPPRVRGCFRGAPDTSRPHRLLRPFILPGLQSPRRPPFSPPVTPDFCFRRSRVSARISLSARNSCPHPDVFRNFLLSGGSATALHEVGFHDCPLVSVRGFGALGACVEDCRPRQAHPLPSQTTARTPEPARFCALCRRHGEGRPHVSFQAERTWPARPLPPAPPSLLPSRQAPDAVTKCGLPRGVGLSRGATGSRLRSQPRQTAQPGPARPEAPPGGSPSPPASQSLPLTS